MAFLIVSLPDTEKEWTGVGKKGRMESHICLILLLLPSLLAATTGQSRQDEEAVADELGYGVNDDDGQGGDDGLDKEDDDGLLDNEVHTQVVNSVVPAIAHRFSANPLVPGDLLFSVFVITSVFSFLFSSCFPWSKKQNLRQLGNFGDKFKVTQ